MTLPEDKKPEEREEDMFDLQFPTRGETIIPEKFDVADAQILWDKIQALKDGERLEFDILQDGHIRYE